MVAMVSSPFAETGRGSGMTPTFIGRIQTRLLLLATVGLVWTILVTPFLPVGDAPLGEVYAATFQALGIVALIGIIIWEPIYHGLQQLRWEKDWPTGIGLVTGLTEGLTTYVVLAASREVSGAAFFVHFATTWILVWASVHGPLRVVLLRWRYRGGRII